MIVRQKTSISIFAYPVQLEENAGGSISITVFVLQGARTKIVERDLADFFVSSPFASSAVDDGSVLKLPVLCLEKNTT